MSGSARRILGIVAGLAIASSAAAQGGTEIYVVELAEGDGRIVVSGAPVRVTDRPGYDNQPAFTADGGALLFTSIRDGQADTYRFDLATGATTRVTRTPESEYSPTPVPGGTRFSVVRVEADSTQRLWSFAADGTDPRLVLPDVAPVGYHAWLDADRLALFVLGDPATLRLADVRTGAAAVMARGIGRSIQARPGRAAATFTREDEGAWSIQELDAETGAIRRIAPMLGPDEYHVWLPGRVLLTAHGTALHRWDTDDWSQVADLSEWGLGTVTRLAVSPSGDRLAVVVDEPEG